RKLDPVGLGVGPKAAGVAHLAGLAVKVIDLEFVAVAPDGGGQLGAIGRELERPNSVAAGASVHGAHVAQHGLGGHAIGRDEVRNKGVGIPA
nr:hypothetical protein [Tanacetum cinerariifolium]